MWVGGCVLMHMHVHVWGEDSQKLNVCAPNLYGGLEAIAQPEILDIYRVHKICGDVIEKIT